MISVSLDSSKNALVSKLEEFKIDGHIKHSTYCHSDLVNIKIPLLKPALA